MLYVQRVLECTSYCAVEQARFSARQQSGNLIIRIRNNILNYLQRFEKSW